MHLFIFWTIFILDFVLSFIDKMKEFQWEQIVPPPLVADLFLFCYERDFMKSLTKEQRYDLIDASNSTSRYLDDLLNIDNIHFEHMVHRIYPAELQLNKANASDTEAAFLDLNLSIHNDIGSTKIYDKRDDFNFDIVNFPSLMAMSLNVPLMVYIYLNLFALPEHLPRLLTSIIVTNSLLPNILSNAIDIINSAKHFPNFIVGTLN